jgi:hypothetical protein
VVDEVVRIVVDSVVVVDEVVRIVVDSVVVVMVVDFVVREAAEEEIGMSRTGLKPLTSSFF